ncbi:DUF1738 domain-containing protein (plasmid) [Bacteroides fragilis]|uniref:DUF1738 domain-containing protein n=2 Tax=Bacteroides fragilis TaxID=817 RepID=A0AAP9N913_BACFG|nr:DUF1738 domain-containing protein [Bacteroides fragilis]
MYDFSASKETRASHKQRSIGFPVLFWNFMIKDDKGNKISMDDYKALTKEEQKEYTVIPYTKPYHVFNVDQTNFAKYIRNNGRH